MDSKEFIKAAILKMTSGEGTPDDLYAAIKQVHDVKAANAIRDNAADLQAAPATETAE